MKSVPGSLLLGMGLCVTATFLATYHPIYDGWPQTGDETMSLSQAMNAVRMRMSAYGYRGDGTPWTSGFFVTPVYLLLYGPVMSLVPPLARIPAARVISHVLMGLALFVCLLTLWRAHRRRATRNAVDHLMLALAAVAVAVPFLRRESFRYVAAFGRADALGAVCVALFVLAASDFLERRTERALGGVALVAVLTGFSSYLPAALCIADLVVLGCWHLLAEPSWRRVRRTVAVALAVAAMAALGVVLCDFVVLHRGIGGMDNETFLRELAMVRDRMSPWGLAGVWVELNGFPGLRSVVVAVAVGATVLLGLARVDLRARADRGSGFGLVLARLAAMLVAAHVAFVYNRFTYVPMLVIALLLPFLDRLVRSPGLRAGRLAAAAAAVVATVVVAPVADTLDVLGPFIDHCVSNRT